MRRKIMTAFVCAIMTISVIPVYADDTQTDQAVTTEVLPKQQQRCKKQKERKVKNSRRKRQQARNILRQRR